MNTNFSRSQSSVRVQERHCIQQGTQRLVGFNYMGLRYHHLQCKWKNLNRLRSIFLCLVENWFLQPLCKIGQRKFSKKNLKKIIYKILRIKILFLEPKLFLDPPKLFILFFNIFFCKHNISWTTKQLLKNELIIGIQKQSKIVIQGK